MHFLVSHPTPPVFDGPEDRNGTRNHDEIRFWADYITPGAPATSYDDEGEPGGLAARRAVRDRRRPELRPLDGDSIPGSIQQLLEHPRVNTKVTPTSDGRRRAAAVAGRRQPHPRRRPQRSTPPTSPTPRRATCGPTTCCRARTCRSSTPASSGRPATTRCSRLVGHLPVPELRPPAGLARRADPSGDREGAIGGISASTGGSATSVGRILADVIVDEPVRGSFAYLEQPGLFALPGVEQLRLFIDRKLPAPPLTHLSGLVVEEAGDRRVHVGDPGESVVADGGGDVRGRHARVRGGRRPRRRRLHDPAEGTALLSSDLSMNFLQPAFPSSERLIARGTVIHTGRRQGLSEARVEDAAGTCSRTRPRDASSSRCRSTRRRLPVCCRPSSRRRSRRRTVPRPATGRS